MNDKQMHALALRETDIQGALKRLNDNEELYAFCLKSFLDDDTVFRLNEALKDGLWDDAFTAAHALKGLAGNMGFVPLMHATGQLLIIIRGGRTKEISEYLERVNSHYRDIIDAIKENF